MLLGSPLAFPRRLVYVACALGGLWLGASPTVRAESSGLWALPPEATELLSRAFAGATLSATDLHVRQHDAVVSLCDRQQCFEVALSHPDDDCSGQRTRAWCVAIPEAGSAYRAEVLAALAAHTPEQVWRRVEAPSPQQRTAPTPPTVEATTTAPPTPEASSTRAAAYALAVAAMLIPLVFGFAFGKPLRRWARARAVHVVLALCPLVVTGLLPVTPAGLGFWDALGVAGLWGVGLVLGTLSPRPAQLAALGLGVTLGAGVLEAGARAVLPHPPAFPPVETAQLVLAPTERFRGEGAARLLYGHTPDAVAALDHDRPVVAHLGDSMLFARSGEMPLVVRLAALDPSRQHVSLGEPATGTDFHYLVLRRWIGEIRPQLVVLHLFENDVADLEAPYAFCGGPLLDYRGDALRWLCPKPRSTHRSWRRVSPAPYPLRVATAFSIAARHACAALRPTLSRQSLAVDQLERRHRRVLAALARTAGQAGASLLVSAMPSRAELEGRLSHQHRSAILSTAREIGLRVVDSQPAFERAIATAPVGEYFRDSADDPHLSARGHALLATWLVQHLGR